LAGKAVIGIDPGKTTGVCVVLLKKSGKVDAINSKELSLGNLARELSEIYCKMALAYAHSLSVVIEDVVKTGRMNKDKFDQIVAFERACNMVDYKQKVIQPENRKRHNIKVPKQVTGTHARDAYKIAVAYMLQEGFIGETSAGPGKK